MQIKTCLGDHKETAKQCGEDQRLLEGTSGGDRHINIEGNGKKGQRGEKGDLEPRKKLLRPIGTFGLIRCCGKEKVHSGEKGTNSGSNRQSVRSLRDKRYAREKTAGRRYNA